MMPFHGRIWFGADAGQTRVQSREWWKLKDRLGIKSDSRYCRGDERGTSRKDSFSSVAARKCECLDPQNPSSLSETCNPLEGDKPAPLFLETETSFITVTLLTGVKHYFKRRRLHTSDLSALTVIGSFFLFFKIPETAERTAVFLCSVALLWQRTGISNVVAVRHLYFSSLHLKEEMLIVWTTGYTFTYVLGKNKN